METTSSHPIYLCLVYVVLQTQWTLEIPENNGLPQVHSCNDGESVELADASYPDVCSDKGKSTTGRKCCGKKNSSNSDKAISDESDEAKKGATGGWTQTGAALVSTRKTGRDDDEDDDEKHRQRKLDKTFPADGDGLDDSEEDTTDDTEEEYNLLPDEDEQDKQEAQGTDRRVSAADSSRKDSGKGTLDTRDISGLSTSGNTSSSAQTDSGRGTLDAHLISEPSTSRASELSSVHGQTQSRSPQQATDCGFQLSSLCPSGRHATRMHRMPGRPCCQLPVIARTRLMTLCILHMLRLTEDRRDLLLCDVQWCENQVFVKHIWISEYLNNPQHVMWEFEHCESLNNTATPAMGSYVPRITLDIPLDPTEPVPIQSTGTFHEEYVDIHAIEEPQDDSDQD